MARRGAKTSHHHHCASRSIWHTYMPGPVLNAVWESPILNDTCIEEGAVSPLIYAHGPEPQMPSDLCKVTQLRGC